MDSVVANKIKRLFPEEEVDFMIKALSAIAEAKEISLEKYLEEYE